MTSKRLLLAICAVASFSTVLTAYADPGAPIRKSVPVTVTRQLTDMSDPKAQDASILVELQTKCEDVLRNEESTPRLQHSVADDGSKTPDVRCDNVLNLRVCAAICTAVVGYYD